MKWFEWLEILLNIKKLLDFYLNWTTLNETLNSISNFAFFMYHCLLNINNTLLPYNALFLRIHLRTDLTLKVFGKFFDIREWDYNPRIFGAVLIGGDNVLKVFRPLLAAPVPCGADPEPLPWCVREKRKTRFGMPVTLCPLFVSIIGRFEASIVSDIFTLGRDSVYLHRK